MLIFTYEYDCKCLDFGDQSTSICLCISQSENVSLTDMNSMTLKLSAYAKSKGELI